jgi:hypothetical protein
MANEPHNSHPEPENTPLLVGWASVDVTPDHPVFLRGQFHARVSTHVRDPLTVTALALSTADDHVVMVSCDRCTIEEGLLDECRQALSGTVPDLDGRKVFASATHTHTAPEAEGKQWPDPGKPVMDGDAYRPILGIGIVSAVTEAWDSRASGSVSWALGHAVVGHNRRTQYLDGSARMYGSTDDAQFAGMEGYEDHSVDLLFTWTPAGDLTGVVVNLACPSQVTESDYFVSADFWHETRVELRRRFGADLFVLPQCAPAGDQSPHLLLHKAAEARMRDLRGVTEREEIALRIANAVEHVLPCARADLRSAVPLRHEVRQLGLTRRQITEEELEEAKRGEAADLARYERLRQESPDNYAAISGAHGHARWYANVAERFRLQTEQPTYPVELHVVRLGDMAFATNPFELFLDFGLRMKARSKAVQTFCVQLAGSGTYVPTERAVSGKSYGAGAASNAVGPEGGQELVEATVALLEELWADG